MSTRQPAASQAALQQDGFAKVRKALDYSLSRSLPLRFSYPAHISAAALFIRPLCAVL